MCKKLKSWWQSLRNKRQEKNAQSVVEQQIIALNEQTQGIKDSIEQQAEALNQQTQGIKDSIEQQAEALNEQTQSIKDSIEQQAEALNQQTQGIKDSIEQQTKTLNNQAQTLCERIEELKQDNGSTDGNIVKAMFDRLIAIPHTERNRDYPFPNPIFPVHYANEDEDPFDIKKEIEKTQESSKHEKRLSCNCILLVSILFLLPLSVYYITSSFFQADCDNLCWQVLVIIIGFFISFAFISQLVIKHIDKQAERVSKLKEKQADLSMKEFSEALELNRQYRKAEISIWEKQEKMRIDEWQRDNDHERKLDIMEQERIAELSNVLKELAKTMNKVTIMDNQEKQDKAKTITIERSILCNDCCNEIKEMVNAAISKGDDNE